MSIPYYSYLQTQGILQEAVNNMTKTVVETSVDLSNVTINNSITTSGMFGGMFNIGIDPMYLAIIGAGIAVGVSGIASAIGAGIAGSTGAKAVAEDPKQFSTALLFQALPQTQGIYGFLIAILILLGAGVVGTVKQITLAQGLGALGAGLAVGIAAVSAIGQGIAASAGIGAVKEDKKMFGKSILFSVLPETQALYGFIISILILIGVGLFGAVTKNIPEVLGWASVGAGLAAGIAGISALGQGIAAAGGIGAVLERSKVFGKSILFSVLPETQALYGFIIAVLILIGFGILGVPQSEFNLALGMFAIAAGLSVGISGISAVGQGMAASAGIGSIAEDDKMFGKSILFSVLPETQALYGFLIGVLILVGGGLIGGIKVGITTPIGVIAIGAALSAGFAAVSAIGQGMSASSGIKSVTEKPSMFGKSIIFSIIPETQALMGFLIAILLLIGSGIIGSAKAGLSMGSGLIAIGAGVAVGLAAVSAVGQGYVVSSSITNVTRNAKMFGKSLLFSVLPQTQALYGFLIAILLLVGGGLVGGVKSGLSTSIGLVAIGAGLAVGLSAMSAIGQGLVASSAVNAVSRNNKMFGKSILFSVLPETQALYGFLVAIILLVSGGLIGASSTSIITPMGIVAIGAAISVGFGAISAIGQGTSAASGVTATSEKQSMFGKSIIFSIIPETQALMGFLIAILMLIGAGLMGKIAYSISIAHGVVAVGAGFAVGMAAISAIGQGFAVSTSINAVTQDAKMFAKSLLFSVIPQTQALMGFLIAILILIGSGLVGSINMAITTANGLVAIGAGFAVGLGALSAVGQGFVISSAITTVTQDNKMFGKGLLFSVLPQTQALYGFLVAILLLVGGGLIGGSALDLHIPVGLLAMGAGLAVGLAAASAIGQGLVAGSGITAVKEDNKMFGKAILFSVLPETQALYGFLIAILLLVGGGLIGTLNLALTVPLGLVAIGAGLSVGVAAVSAIGQGVAASSGVASVQENSKMFGKSILFSVLPETQALYGTIISILLMTGVGIMGVIKSGVTMLQGFGAIGAGLAIGFAAISALGQGIISASSIGASLKDAKSMGKGLVLSVIPETYAIFGLLISILMLLGLKII